MAKTLLVVDDSATIREAARLALTGEGWLVQEAASSQEALALLGAGGFDAVLCDVALGDEDGYELCRTIRLGSGGADVPVVLMGSRVSRAAATAVGAAATLPKPFGSDELVEALQSAAEESSFVVPESEATTDRGLDPLEILRTDDRRSFAVPQLEERTEPALEPVEPGFEDLPPSSTDEEVEIIELASEDEFGDLELLDDLEPIESASIAPRAPAPGELNVGDLENFPGLSEEPERPTESLFPERSRLLEEALGGELSLELDAFQEAVESPRGFRPEAAAEPELNVDLGALQEPEESPRGFQQEASPGRELEIEVDAFDRPSEPPEAFAPEVSSEREIEIEVDGFEPQTPSFVEGPVGDDAEIVAEPATPAPAGPDEALLIDQLARTAEQAARSALEKSLSLERLLPAVEAVVERVVWEVVPQLAERMIQEAIERLRQEPPET